MYNSLMSPTAKSPAAASSSGPAKEKLFYFLSDEMAILLLAFVGGYVDCAGYIKLDGLFTSSITGNLVAACASVYHNDGAVARASVSIAFALAAALTVFAIMRLKLVNEWSKKSIAILFFIVEAVLLIAAMALGLPYDDDISSDGAIFRWPLIVVGAILGASMGVHNAVAKEYIPSCPATTVMTMTLVSISIGWAQMMAYAAAHYLGLSLLPPGKPLSADYSAQILQKTEASMANFNKVVKPLLAFLAGAILASVITMYTSFWSIAVSVALCGWIALDIALTDLIPYSQGEESGAGDGQGAIASSSGMAQPSPTLVVQEEEGADVESSMTVSREKLGSDPEGSLLLAPFSSLGLEDTLYDHMEDGLPREEEPTLPIPSTEEMATLGEGPPQAIEMVDRH